MVLLSALLSCVVSRGLITQGEADEIHDLYSLQKVLEGAADRILTKAEKDYVTAINRLLEEKRFDLIPKVPAPSSLIAFSENLQRILPSLTSTAVVG